MATACWDSDEGGGRSGFWASGHTPTLVAAFLYFDLAFMVWVLLGPLAPDIARALALTPAQKGLMVAVPTLAGAALRVVNGLLVDRIGPKRSGAISQIIVIAGLFAPALAKLFGWNAVLGLSCIPLSIVFVACMLLALGTGNGAVFQLVPQRFAAEIGVMTGLVGMAGGVGGSYLASSLGLARQWTGSFAPGFLIVAGLAVIALAGLGVVKARWRRDWAAAANVRI